MQAVFVKTSDFETVVRRPSFVPASHYPQEMHEFPVSPHPAREMDEGLALSPCAALANETIEFRCVRPVRLDRQNAEPVPLDQAPSDGGARQVKFRRPMRRFAEQEDPGVREGIEMRCEGVGLMQAGQGLRLIPDMRGKLADCCR